MNQNLEKVAAKLLALWAAKKTSLFMIFKMAKDSGGSTSCVIDTFSPDALRLSWPGENKSVRRGELVISLQGATPTVSGIDLPEVVSGADFVNPSEPFVLMTLPSGDRFWLVPSRSFELDDAFKLSDRAVGDIPKDPSAPEKEES